MKRIRLLTGRVGDGFVQQAGDVLIVGDDIAQVEAVRLVNSQQAVALSDEVESATVVAPERQARTTRPRSRTA